jgi:hypothetical protein
MTWNPKTFVLEALRRSGESLGDWRVGRYRQALQRDDRFVLWRSGTGGITAVGCIRGAPEFKNAPFIEHWTKPPERAWFVPISIDAWHDRQISFKDLRADDRLTGMSFLAVPGAANPHPLTDEHWNALMTYL